MGVLVTLGIFSVLAYIALLVYLFIEVPKQGLTFIEKINVSVAVATATIALVAVLSFLNWSNPYRDH